MRAADTTDPSATSTRSRLACLGCAVALVGLACRPPDAAASRVPAHDDAPAPTTRATTTNVTTTEPGTDRLELAVGYELLRGEARLYAKSRGGTPVNVPAGGAVVLVVKEHPERSAVTTISIDMREALGADAGLDGLRDFALILHTHREDLLPLPAEWAARIDAAEDVGPPPPQEDDDGTRPHGLSSPKRDTSRWPDADVTGEHVVGMGTAILWEDGTTAGEVWHDHAFARAPMRSRGLSCFDVPIDDGAMPLRLCFAPKDVARVEPRKPRVTSLKVTAQGTLRGDVIEKRIREESDSILACYVTATERESTPKGTATLSFSIAADGTVTDARVTDANATGFGNAVLRLDECMASAMRAWNFPAEPGRASIRASARIAFQD